MTSTTLRGIAPLAALLALLSALPARADDYDDLGGFGEAEEGDEFAVDVDESQDVDHWWDLDGSLALSSSVNYLSHDSATGTDYTGLSRLRLRLNLELDVDLPRDWDLRLSPFIWYDFSYLINGFDNFTDAVIGDYQWQGDFQDSYIEGPLLENLDLKIGRQVVNWGRSDSIRVLDVLNPLDNREPGRADIEDLRWAVGMIRADWYPNTTWSVQAIGIPEMRFDDIPPVGSDFNPSTMPIPTEKPRSWENWDYGFAIRGIFEGWDASLHYARIFRDIPTIEVRPNPPSPIPELVQTYDRLHMIGAGGDYAWGAWLFKAEAAGFQGFRYLGDGGKEHWRVDVMGGLEYYGINDNTLAVEIANRHVVDYVDEIFDNDFIRENNTEWAFRWTADWMNARLQTTILALVFGWGFQDGAVIRAQGAYTIRDGLVFTAGMLIYQEGDAFPLDTWGRNDRVFFDLKWSF